MAEDQFEQLRVDGRPDGFAAWFVCCAHFRCCFLRPGHVGNRYHDLDLELLLPRCIYHGDRSWQPLGLRRFPAPTPEEFGDCLQRTLRRRQTDALQGAVGDSAQSLQAERQVAAALGAGHRVDLVDDDKLDRGEHLTCL